MSDLYFKNLFQKNQLDIFVSEVFNYYYYYYYFYGK